MLERVISRDSIFPGRRQLKIIRAEKCVPIYGTCERLRRNLINNGGNEQYISSKVIRGTT